MPRGLFDGNYEWGPEWRDGGISEDTGDCGDGYCGVDGGGCCDGGCDGVGGGLMMVPGLLKRPAVHCVVQSMNLLGPKLNHPNRKHHL